MKIVNFSFQWHPDDNCGSDDCVSVNIEFVKFCMEQLRLACSSPYQRRYSNDDVTVCFHVVCSVVHVLSHSVRQ
jgi:hypothetical protein